MQRVMAIMITLGMVLIIAGFLLPAREPVGCGTVKSILPVDLKYISHSVIRINSDSEFAQIAQQEGWLGNGSANNPLHY